MSDFSRCPECGETNYQEQYGIRTFDCGFKGFFDERRARCASATRRGARQSPETDDNRYRLALLDAAQVIDVLAADMTRDGESGPYADRCRALSKQLREFAGHTGDAASFGGMSARKPPGRFAALARRFSGR